MTPLRPSGPGYNDQRMHPVSHANVNVGTKDRAPWENYSTYLSGLAAILTRQVSGPLVIVGDFNQQIGQRRRPYPPRSHPVRARLQESVPASGSPGMAIATGGLGLRGRRAVDHIAISQELSAASLTTIDNTDGERRLSGYLGVVADLSTRDAPENPSQKSERYDNQQSSFELAPRHRA